MIKHSESISTPDKILLAAYPVCLLAFALPASSLRIAGQSFTQYLLAGYAGWAAFGVILLFGVIQLAVFYRKRKILKWMDLVAGLYAAWFALKLIVESYSANHSSTPSNLAGNLHFAAAPMVGLFLLAAAGGLLFVLSLVKIADRRLT